MSIRGHFCEDKGLLSVSETSVRRGGVYILRNISFTIRLGETVGITGGNGSGKTTILDALSGFIKADGRICFRGAELISKSPQERADLGISRTFQESAVTRELTVWENILLGDDRKVQLHPGHGTPSAEWGTHFNGRLNDFSGWLSNANKRRLEIMRSVARSPALLLLDEPTAGMNDYEASEFSQWLASWRKSCQDLSIIVCEHRPWVITALDENCSIYNVVEGELERIKV